MGLVMTLSIDIQLNSMECHYAECRNYLNVMLSFLAPAKLFVLGETFRISQIFMTKARAYPKVSNWTEKSYEGQTLSLFVRSVKDEGTKDF